jgi:hypothetical protein
MSRFIKALTLALSLIAGQQFAFAQYGPPPAPGNNPAPNNNRPVVFHGREDLPGMGELTFIATNGGKVRMIDASKQPIDGSFAIQGNRVVFAFGNCVYDGNLDNNDVLTGTGRFTSGPNAGQTWNFSVRAQP